MDEISMAREAREAAEARWPEDEAESEEEDSEEDGDGVQVEFKMVERDVQYEKG